MVFTRSQLRARNAEIAEMAKLFTEMAEIRRESESNVAAVAAEPEMERSSVMTQHSNDVEEEEIMEEEVWKEEQDGAVVSVDDLRAVAVKDCIATGVSVLAAVVTVVVCAASIYAGFGVYSNLMKKWQPMTDEDTIVIECWTRFTANLHTAWIASKWGLWAAWIVFKWIVWPFFKWIVWPVVKAYPLKSLYVMEASVLVCILWRKVLLRR